MSLIGEDRLDDEDVEYNHRDESGDEESENSGQAIEVIREIFTPKETRIKVSGICFRHLRRNIYSDETIQE